MSATKSSSAAAFAAAGAPLAPSSCCPPLCQPRPGALPGHCTATRQSLALLGHDVCKRIQVQVVMTRLQEQRKQRKEGHEAGQRGLEQRVPR